MQSFFSVTAAEGVVSIARVMATKEELLGLKNRTLRARAKQAGVAQEVATSTARSDPRFRRVAPA